MGALVHVYRFALGDCTAGGISSTHDSLVVVNAPGPHVPTDEHPAVWLEDRSLHGLTPILVPAERLDDGTWVPSDFAGPRGSRMAGGNLAGASDGRWCRHLEAMGMRYPHVLAIHDRFEPWR